MKEKENGIMSLLSLLKGPVSGHNLVMGIFFTTAAGVILGFVIGQIVYHLFH